MKVQSFKSVMFISLCVWGATGALAFVAGKHFGISAFIADATKNAKPGDKDAMARALEKALSGHSGNAKDPGAPSADQLLAMKGKPDAALLARWAASLSPSDCQKEMADLQKMPAGAKRDAMLAALADSWAKQDPQGFLATASKMTNAATRDASINKALTAWAAQDPKAALAWLDKNPAGTAGLQNQQFQAIVAGFAANNPQEAFAYVNGLADGANPQSPDSQKKLLAMQALIGGMADQGNFQDILGYIGQIPAGTPLQNQAYAAMMQQWSSDSPSDAAQWLATLDPTQNGRQIRQYSNMLVSQWALSDPMAAAAWAQQQDAQNLANNQNAGGRGGPGGGRGGAGNLLYSAVGQMVNAGDVDQAGNYLNTLQAGPEKDSAISAFVQGAATQDPAGAMGWVQTITDPNIQARMTNTVAADWYQTDPNGFSQYLSTLDPNTAAQLQQAATQGGGFGGFGGRGGPGGGGFGAAGGPGGGGFNGGFGGGPGGGGFGAGTNGGGQTGAAINLGNGQTITGGRRGGGTGGRRGGGGGGGGGGG